MRLTAITPLHLTQVIIRSHTVIARGIVTDIGGGIGSLTKITLGVRRIGIARPVLVLARS